MTKSSTNESIKNSHIKDINDLDLKLLKIFKIVSECEGFSAAEIELNISKSAISRYMSDLESRLKMKLCHRGRSGFYLTEEGKHVLNYYNLLLDNLDTFRNQLNEIHTTLTGSLSIGLTDNTITDSNSRVIEAISLLKNEGPRINITMDNVSHNNIETLLIDGSIDIGVLPYHYNSQNLTHEIIYKEKSLLFCANTHPLYNLHKLDEIEELIMKSDYVTPGYKVNKKQEDLQKQFKNTAKSYKIEGIASLILTGSYIGFLPVHYAQKWIDKFEMKAINSSKYAFETYFTIAYKNNSKPSKLAKRFIEILSYVHSDPRGT